MGRNTNFWRNTEDSLFIVLLSKPSPYIYPLPPILGRRSNKYPRSTAKYSNLIEKLCPSHSYYMYSLGVGGWWWGLFFLFLEMKFLLKYIVVVARMELVTLGFDGEKSGEFESGNG